jgi:hypothetical protein
LALAGYDPEELRARMEADHGASNVKDFVGADLSLHITGEREGDIHGPGGKPRMGVFYMTNDMITEPGPVQSDDYIDYLAKVEELRLQGYPLESGPITQPNNVRALCTGDWKLVRYVDPHGVEPDEWELYCLSTDPIERTNLVDFRTGEVRDDVSVPGMTKNELEHKNRQLKRELAQQEAAMLGKPS